MSTVSQAISAEWVLLSGALAPCPPHGDVGGGLAPDRKEVPVVPHRARPTPGHSEAGLGGGGAPPESRYA
jgi:hypothetical protein